MPEIIRLTQKPVIEHALKKVGEQVTKRLKDLNLDSQVATEDTVKALKSLRAELNKELSDYEEQRKAIKEGVMAPYNDFEGVYKDEISTKYKDAVETLKKKIDTVEDQIKKNKEDSLLKYFAEKTVGELSFLKWSDTNITVNLSTSEKSYTIQIDEFIARINDDIKMIEASEYPVESMVEYKLTLNASKSVVSVKERKAKEKDERNKKRQDEVLKLGLKYHGENSNFEHPKDSSIKVSIIDIQNLSDNDWRNKMEGIKSSVDLIKPESNVSKTVVPSFSSPTPKEVKIETVITPSLMKFTFEAEGTMGQISGLVNFMKEHNISYKEK